MDILGVGDIFGEMAILEEQPRSATATAIEPVTVLHFDRDNFVSMMMSTSRSWHSSFWSCSQSASMTPSVA